MHRTVSGSSIFARGSTGTRQPPFVSIHLQSRIGVFQPERLRRHIILAAHLGKTVEKERRRL
jgi:hypothetical protein